MVITGLGLISPLGNRPETLWDALSARRSGVGPLASLPPGSLPVSFAAEAREFSGRIEDFGELEGEQKKQIRKGLKVMCRECLMGVAASQLALADSKLKPAQRDPERAGIIFGSDYMVSGPEEFVAPIEACLDEQREFHFSRWSPDGLSKMNPLWLLKYLPNMPASHVAIYNDLRGPNNSLTHREASGNLAIGEAFRIIVRDHADVMLAGATGTRVHPMKALHARLLEELSTEKTPERASRPFDRDRSGMVLGEGAGAILLEELEHAQARDATIFGEVVGAASSAVVDRSLVARQDVALANAMRAVLREADCAPENVGHIHAHGLGARQSDIDESRALAEVFGPRRCAGSRHGGQELLWQPRRGKRRGGVDRQHAGPRTRRPVSRLELRNPRSGMPRGGGDGRGRRSGREFSQPQYHASRAGKLRAGSALRRIGRKHCNCSTFRRQSQALLSLTLSSSTAIFTGLRSRLNSPWRESPRVVDVAMQ